MWTLKKSSLFKHQLIYFAKNYKEIANRFLDSVENSLSFIQSKPLACSIYQDAKKHPLLQQYEFRKWPIKGFRHYVFFRVLDNQEILLEAIYAYRMDTITHFGSDFKIT